MKDEIIEELWRIKDELAREANYDIHVLCRELERERGLRTRKSLIVLHNPQFRRRCATIARKH